MEERKNAVPSHREEYFLEKCKNEHFEIPSDYTGYVYDYDCNYEDSSLFIYQFQSAGHPH